MTGPNTADPRFPESEKKPEEFYNSHSPQPHLDCGYTVFGHVSETDMKVVDNIVRGDRILSVRIVETLVRRKK